MLFTQGTVVRLRNDPSCSGQITGVMEARRNRAYWEVQLADGSGRRKFPQDQLEAATTASDPMADLMAGHFADPDLLRRLILHERLNGRQRDVLYSMDVTDTEFHAYQFKPVVKLLSSPSQGLLIADEVGLGKTIEAGLVWTELVARFDAHRLLVVCPKSLTEKWRQELWQKFSVDAKIVDAAGLMEALRRDAEGADGFALIVSLSSARPPRGWQDEGDGARAELARFLTEQESSPRPLIDCVIFDEAHHLRNPVTRGHDFARAVMGVSDYKLLLSATPINLHSEDLRSLLSLVDPDTFDNVYTFEVLNEENKPLVQARDMALQTSTEFSDLVATLRTIPRGELLKIGRQLDNLQRELAQPGLTDSRDLRVRIGAQLEEMSLLGSVVNRTRRRDVNSIQVKRDVKDLKWTMSSAEQAFYDQASDVVREHAYQLDASELFLLATPQRLIASSLAAACRHWAAKAGDWSTDEDDADLREGDGDGKVDRSVKRRRDRTGPLAAKLALLSAEPGWHDALEREDTKLGCLLTQIIRHNAAGDDKVVVFSSFRATLDYLAEKLCAQGHAIEIMHGGIKEERTAILARFADREGPGVLLTSEVGGEGLDMQFCRALINYDLPWNPMKVEQRIGRLDRIGQKAAKINITSLIAAGTIEDRIYSRLYARLLMIQETLGAFEAILGDEVNRLEQILLDPNLTPEQQEEEIDRSAMALIQRQKLTEALEEEAPGLIAHGQMILEQIEANHRPERRITSEELADYVHEALAGRFPGTRIDNMRDAPGLYDVQLSETAHLALKRLMVRGGRYRTRLTRETRVRAAFEKLSNLPKSVEVVSPVHPLVRLARTVREEAIAGAAPNPVISVSIPAPDSTFEMGTYVAAIEHWSVVGAVPVDRIVYGACRINGDILDPIEAERLVHAALRDGKHVRGNIPLDVVARRISELRENVLDESFSNFLEEEEARHCDRADTTLAKIERQRRKRTSAAEERLWQWKVSGDPRKLRMVPAEQAKLNKYLARLDDRRDSLLAAKSRFSQSCELVGFAIITVE